MAMGDDTHKLPVRADIRKVIGKEVGDTVANVFWCGAGPNLGTQQNLQML